jgi:hypothetical protein
VRQAETSVVATDHPAPASGIARRLGALLAGGKRAWDGFWFAPVSPYPIAAFRVLFGMYLIWYFGRFAGQIPLLFSAEGVYLPFLLGDLEPRPALAWTLYGLTLVAAALFTVGLWTRLATPLVLLGYLYHYYLQFGTISSAYDRFHVILLIILCGADLEAAWSVNRCGEVRQVRAWATRLLCLEVAFMYFGSGLYKLLNPLWRDGKLIEMTLAGPWATPVAFWVVEQQLPAWAYDVAAWGVIVLELSLGFGLYNRRTRAAAIAAGAAFHAANWLLLGIPELLSYVAAYTLFLPGESIERGAQRVRHVDVTISVLTAPPPAMLRG